MTTSDEPRSFAIAPAERWSVTAARAAASRDAAASDAGASDAGSPRAGSLAPASPPDAGASDAVASDARALDAVPSDAVASDALPLFLFGTLRDETLFEVVFGRPQHALRCRTALLPGHAALRVAGADFPVLVAAASCRQPGLIVEGLAQSEVARAVFYESTGYRLAPVRPVVAGRPVAAQAFLPTGRHPVSGERWRLAAWRRRHGPWVVTAAALVFAHYGRIDADGFDALWPEIERETAARLAAGGGARPGRRRERPS